MPGHLLSLGPATLSTLTRLSRSQAASMAGSAVSGATTRKGLDSFKAKTMVSRVPPVGLASDTIRVASESSTFCRVRGG